MIDESLNLSLEITWQEVVFQQDAVLQSLVPSFDLALSLRMIRRTARVLHAFALQPFSRLPETKLEPLSLSNLGLWTTYT